MEELSQRRLRNESGEVMRRLAEGESFIVTSNGEPVGELSPLHRRRFVSATAVVALFRMAPAVDYREFRADLDSWVNQDPTPRG